MFVSNLAGYKMTDGFQGGQHVKKVWGNEGIAVAVNDSGIVGFPIDRIDRQYRAFILGPVFVRYRPLKIPYRYDKSRIKTVLFTPMGFRVGST